MLLIYLKSSMNRMIFLKYAPGSLCSMNDILEEIEDEQDLYNERDHNMPPLGSMVRRGRDWQWGDQDRFGPGTIVGHSKKGGWLKVEWDMDSTTIHHYRYGSNCNELDKYDVKVCDEPRVLENQLIATGCLVTRGPDWNWYDQDGGVGNVGSVLSVNVEVVVYNRV